MNALLACMLLIAAALPQESPRGFRRATVALVGPLEEAILTEPSGSTTRIECALASGSHLLLAVPLWASLELSRRATGTTRPAEGTVELRSIEEEHWDDPWSALVPGLRLRSRPPVELAARTPGLAAGSLLVATLVGVAGLRKRTFLALGIGLVGAAALVILPLGTTSGRVTCVLEGDAPSGGWLCVQARAEELELPDGGPLALEVDPIRAPLLFRVEHSQSGVDRWFVEARGARLVRIDALRAPGGQLEAEDNTLLDLESCWVRDADGTWTDRGSWRRGERLPAARAGSLPPGWLASLLPQGVGILIGRVSHEAFDRAGWGLPEPAPEEAPWVRWIGF